MDVLEAFGIKFSNRRDPSIPDGSVWRNRRFFHEHVVVGYSAVCDRYHARSVYPKWIQEQLPKSNPGMWSAEEIKAMKRVK